MQGKGERGSEHFGKYENRHSKCNNRFWNVTLIWAGLKIYFMFSFPAPLPLISVLPVDLISLAFRKFWGKDLE
jgi:hypothetical protein